jgi:hypothetical protein
LAEADIVPNKWLSMDINILNPKYRLKASCAEPQHCYLCVTTFPIMERNVPASMLLKNISGPRGEGICLGNYGEPSPRVKVVIRAMRTRQPQLIWHAQHSNAKLLKFLVRIRKSELPYPHILSPFYLICSDLGDFVWVSQSRTI